METKKVHASCLKVIFGPKTKMPTDREIFGFFRTRNWTCDMLSAMFREPKEYAVYVMFRTEDMMKTELLKCPPSATFVYEGHQETKVTFAAARGNFRYVRIFGLPIEVDDKHVAAAMSKYGKIQHMVRERYGADTGYPIMNGVRGVHIEMEHEIPSQIYIQHFQAKVFYDGMSSKCFVCGGSDHVKANCPKRTSVNARLNQNGGTYAGIVADGAKKDDFPTLIDISQETSGGTQVGTQVGAQQSTAVVGDTSSAVAGPSKPLTVDALLGQTAEVITNNASDEVSLIPGEKQHDDLMDFEEVKSKKRSRKQQKDTTKDVQRSSSATSDSDGTAAAKLKINSSGNDLIEMQVRRSRSKQSKK